METRKELAPIELNGITDLKQPNGHDGRNLLHFNIFVMFCSPLPFCHLTSELRQL